MSRIIVAVSSGFLAFFFPFLVHFESDENKQKSEHAENARKQQLSQLDFCRGKDLIRIEDVGSKEPKRVAEKIFETWSLLLEEEKRSERQLHP